MAHAVFTNNARTTLSGSLTNVATSASVVDGSVFPAPTGGDYAYLTIEEGVLVEIVKLTARSTNTLTITRAQDGTTAQAFTTAAAVSLRLPRVVLDEFQAAIDAKLNSSAVSAFGGTLIDDADASTARTTLGLGTAAVKNTGTSGDAVPLLNAANTFSAAQIIETAATLPQLTVKSDKAAGIRFQNTDADTGTVGEIQVWSALGSESIQSRAGRLTWTVENIGQGNVGWSLAGKQFDTENNILASTAAGVLSYRSHTVWHAGNDGAGTGLDADTLDGVQPSAFALTILDDADASTARTTLGLGTAAVKNTGTSGDAVPLLNAANTFSADQTIASTSPGLLFNETDAPVNNTNWRIRANASTFTLGTLDKDGLNPEAALSIGRSGVSIGNVQINGATLTFNANTVWHAGNDGAGSGLDADTLDGLNSDGFLRLATSGTQTLGSGSALQVFRINGANSGTNQGSALSMDLGGATCIAIGNASAILGGAYNATPMIYTSTGTLYIQNTSQLVYHSGNDGAGSGLDADLLDGIQGAGYARNGGSTTADLNTIVTSGMWRLEGSNANLPSGTAYGQLIVSRGSDTILQIASDYQGQHLYFRNGNSADVGGSGAYSAWRTIWHSGNFDPATKANLSGATFSGAVTFNGAMTLPGAIKVGGGWQAGSLAYTDANWGMLNRPPVAGALGAHRWDKFDGTEIMRITEAGSLSIGDVNTVTTYGARLGVTSAASTQATICIWNPGIGFAHIGIAASNSNLKLYNSYSTGTLSGGAGIDINISGNVGIGTDSPTNGILELRKDASSAIGPVLALNNQGGGGLTGSAINFIGAGSQNIAAQIRGSDDGNWAHNLIFSTKQTGASGNALTERMRIASDGVITAATDFRAPIFYDSNDTAFYADPNGTSRLNQARFQSRISIGDGNGTPFLNTGSPGVWFSFNGAADIFLGAESTTSAGFYLGDWRFRVNSSGQATASGDFRAPIFYDSNNTGFYLDPNSLSVLSTTSTYLAPKDPNANWNTAFQNTPASSYAWHGDSASGTNNPGGAWWFSESMRHGNNTSFWGTQIAWGWEDNANRLLQRNVNSGNYSAWVEYLNTSGRTFSGDLVMGSSLRAPVFYDSANTAFYTDPNGTSVLWKVDVLHGQSVGSLLTASGGLGGLEVKSNSATDAAFINFHRPSAYAAYFGIDTDNQFAVGGWSAGAALAAMKVGQLGVGTAASGTTGEIRATNNITAYYSDMRLKDITGKITNAIEKVTQLNGYYYVENELAEQYGYKNKKEQVGVGAQEVEQVLPHVVTPAPFDIAKNEDGVEYSKSGENYLTVRYERLIPLLIEAIKEQQLQIEQQSARIDQLMAQVNEGE